MLSTTFGGREVLIRVGGVSHFCACLPTHSCTKGP